MTIASLTTIVRRALAGEAAVPPGAAVVVAVSGGPDSMALLSVMARLASKHGLRVRAHGIDHGLREDAGAELDVAETQATRLQIPFDRTRVQVPAGGNLQERARVARWAALVQAARRDLAVIATAHHADDRAETILMRLLRGAGLRGLAALPPRATAPFADDVTVVRPMLRARRSDVLLHLERASVPFVTDPSNVDPRYLRARVRRDVLPLLEGLDPAVVRHLEALADEIGSPTELPGGFRLPRATQLALEALARDRPRDAAVWLPGGLVVRVDPKATAPKRSRK